MPTRTDFDPELLREVLSQDERTLWGYYSRGKSLGAIAQLQRQYEGPNGVREAIEQIEVKLTRAANGERPLETVLADLREQPDAAGLPIRSVPAGSMNGAGAEPPPSVAAPPGDQRQRPSSGRLPAVAETPARRPPNAVIGMARERAIRELLERRSATVAELAEEMDVKRNVVDNALARMSSKGIVVAEGSRGGSRLWKLKRDAPLPAIRVDLPTPPPASARAAEPASVAIVNINNAGGADLPGLQLRYAECLVTVLENLISAHEVIPVELMDRIERVLAVGASTEAD